MSSLTVTDPDAPQLSMRAAFGQLPTFLGRFLGEFSHCSVEDIPTHPPEGKSQLVSLYEIFSAASDIDDPRERQQYLDEACGDDAELRERLEALLRSANAADDRFMESPPPVLAAALDLPQQSLGSRPGEAATDGWLVADTLGDYRILAEIGRGGMGVVYEAEQISLGRRVALKVLSYASILDKTKLERFKNEARAAASLDHPNVVHVHAVGTHRGVHYSAMQFIDGQTVEALIREERRRRGLEAAPGPIPFSSMDNPTKDHTVPQESPASQRKAFHDTSFDHDTSVASVAGTEERKRIRGVVELAIQAAEALEHAHQMGIVHRDIKPSNLLIDVEGKLWVTDFGLAMIEAEGNLTTTGSMVGTLRYMSPEQMRGDRHVLDHHTDIYSLGATLYEMVTLRAAFPENNATRLMQQIPVDEPTAPRRLNQAIPRDLETIIFKAMAKDHEDRYATAASLAEDLRRFLNDQPIRARPPGAVERARKWARRHRAIVATAAGTLGLAVMVAGALLWNERSETLAAYAAVTEQHERARRNESEARRQALAANLARAAEAEARAEALKAQREAEKARQQAELDAQKAREKERLTRQLVYAGDVRLAAQAWDSGDLRHYTDLLDGLKRSEPSLCGFEWSYLRQLGMAHGRTIAEGTGGTCSVRHSPDGQHVAIGQYDGSIRLLSSNGYQVLAERRAHLGLVRSLDFSADGMRLVSFGDDGMVRVWSIPECDELLAFRGCKKIGFVALFARDGTVLLTGSEEPGLKLWDSETGESRGEFNTDQACIRTMAISPGGHCVASGDYQTFGWNLQDGKRLWKHRGNFVRCLRVSQDGEFVAMGTAAQRVMLMNIRTGEVIESLEGHADDIDGLAFHPDGGLLASADRAGVIRLWRLDVDDADTQSVEGSMMLGQPDIPWPRCFRAHSDRAWALDFSPNGDRLLSCSKDGTVKAWARRPPQMECARETGDLVDLVFTRSGEEVLVCETNRIRLWARGTGQQEIFGVGITPKMSSVAISPDGRTVLCGDLHGQVYLWDRVQGKVVRTVSMHDDHVDRIRFRPDGGMMLTSSWDGTTKLWRVDSYEELATFRLPPHCEDAAFSPDGKLLAISSQNDAIIYEVSSQKAVHVLRGHQNTVDCLAFSPDGRQLVTGSHDRTIRLWDVQSGETTRVIPAHRNKILAIDFSPDGRTIASGDKAGILAFSHVETGRFLFDLELADQAIRALMFSPDGQALAVAATEKVLMLQINDTSAGAAEAAEPRTSNSDFSSKRNADGLRSR